MKDERRKNEPSADRSQTGLTLKSGLRAGFSCPAGWWKAKDGKDKYCCHWVWQPGFGYVAECNM